MLPPETVAEIRRLFHADHLTMHAIARHLGVHHDTVRNIIQGEHAAGRPPASVLRSSILDPYVPFMVQKIEEFPHLTSTALHRMLAERGYKGAVQTVRRRVRELRPARRHRRAFLPLTVYPGEEAQVDWASFGKLTVGRAERRLSCFVMVLSHSRAAFARFAFDQTLESFLLGHVLAFRALGGVPRRLRYDNLKTAVIERHGKTVRFHPALVELSGRYRFQTSACNPYSGHEKGRVERTIRYIRDSFYAGRSPRTISEANMALERWLAEVCNQRPWPDDRTRTVAEVWAEERERLLALPAHEPEVEHERTVRSGKQPYVRFDLNDYSIPFQLVTRPLSLRASEETIRIFDGEREVASHKRRFGRGERATDPAHFAGLYADRPGAETVALREYLKGLIPESAALYDLMVDHGVGLGPATAKILGLIDTYGRDAVADAMRQALAHGISRPTYLTQALQAAASRRAEPPRLPLDLPDRPGVRDLTVQAADPATYDTLAGGRTGGAETDHTENQKETKA